MKISVALPVLLALPLIVIAAPPPTNPVPVFQGEQQRRDALRQVRRLDRAGIAIPNPPANGGQCVVDTQGQLIPPAGQRGVSETYRLQEIHRWEVSTTPSNPGQFPLVYPVTWTSSGNGERHADNGVGTRNDWTFTIAGTGNTRLSATRIASNGNWLIQLALASTPGGVAIVQQQTVSGTPPALPVNSTAVSSAVSYPAMTVAGTPPNNAARISETRSFRVPTEMNWGYPRPAYATGSISCTWNLAVGP